jgi:hypothetical protein
MARILHRGDCEDQETKEDGGGEVCAWLTVGADDRVMLTGPSGLSQLCPSTNQMRGPGKWRCCLPSHRTCVALEEQP